MSEVAAAVAAIRAGRLVVIPTDTVYGLACAADDERAVHALSAAKGRSPDQPVALITGSVERLLARLPELPAAAAAAVRALLPGAYTLVLPDPGARFPWLAGARAGTVGVRVPALDGVAAQILGAVDAVAATSANLHGEGDPRRLSDVHETILAAAAAHVDGGELPGTASTVLDLTGPEPQVLREGAVPRDEALARVAAALGE